MTPAIDRMLEDVLAREGGHVNDPDDSGGDTKFGVTEVIARKAGYTGAMKDLSRDEARRILYDLFIVQPGFDHVIALDHDIGEELVDTGINMGVLRAGEFLQRCLNVFNQRAEHFPDIKVDGKVGPDTRAALKSYFDRRGAVGRAVLLGALNSLQGAFYIELAERREKDEKWVYGWVRARVLVGAR
jgi:lysozyme family protein